jgi:hypothetical protein
MTQDIKTVPRPLPALLRRAHRGIASRLVAACKASTDSTRWQVLENRIALHLVMALAHSVADARRHDFRDGQD